MSTIKSIAVLQLTLRRKYLPFWENATPDITRNERTSMMSQNF